MHDLEKEKHGDNQYHAREKAIVAAFEGFTNGVATKLKYEETPWLNLTWFMLGVQLIISMLVSFFRPDFVTLTAVALGLYFLDKPENCRRIYFRYLVVLLLVSIVYDFLFLFWINDYDNDNEGSGESSLKKFSLLMSWISFCWRVSNYYV